MTSSETTSPAAPLAGRNILLVEDEVLVAILLEDMLGELGCARVVSASTVTDALAQLSGFRPDAAMLDVNLAGEMVYPVAERLAAENIPFVFTTGYGARGVADAWAGRPVLQKPYSMDALSAQLQQLMRLAAA
jgi:CheY-like chemotaxis protein